MIDAIIDETRAMRPAELRRSSSPEQRYWIADRSSIAETHQNEFLVPPAELFISVVTQRGLREPLVAFDDDPRTIFDRLFDFQTPPGAGDDRRARRPREDDSPRDRPRPPPDRETGLRGPDGPMGAPPGPEGPPRFSGPQPRDPVQWRIAAQLPDGRWFNAEMIWPRSNQWTQPLWGQVALMALATVLIVVMVVRRATQGLRQLATAADKLGRGESIEPLPEQGPTRSSAPQPPSM